MPAYHSTDTSPSIVKKRARRCADRKHVCKFCNMTFKRSEHCARHQRGHTQERLFSCRYCPKNYTRADVALRHEKDLHWEKYVSRMVTSPHSRISARTLREGATDDGDTSCSWTPEPEQRSTSTGQNRPDVSRILSGQPTERLPISPGIASYPSSPNTIIEQAIAAQDFTTLHAEALSLNYITTPFPSALPPEPEIMSTGMTSSEMQPSKPSGETSIVPTPWGQRERWSAPDEAPSSPATDTLLSRQDAARDGPDTILVPDEDILTLGPVFDPLWDPVVTKTAAINGYVADLHREMMIKAGLWSK